MEREQVELDAPGLDLLARSPRRPRLAVVAQAARLPSPAILLGVDRA
jgi:hypothetical protein